MIEVLVGQRGEIVIPKRIRKRYGILPGKRVQIIEGEHKFTLQPRTREEELEETRARWAALRRPVDPELLRKALAMEPYDD